MVCVCVVHSTRHADVKHSEIRSRQMAVISRTASFSGQLSAKPNSFEAWF